MTKHGQRFMTRRTFASALAVALCCAAFAPLKPAEGATVLRPGARRSVVIEGVEVPFRYCPPGTFLMGSGRNDVERAADETQREVTIAKGFWIAETETTQEFYEAVLNDNPSRIQGASLPVESVSWDDACAFARKLNSGKTRPKGLKYRLPTEAEWEYACRAGSVKSRSGELDKIAWYNTNSERRMHPVAQKQKNAWGIADMTGNCWEWCLDWKAPYDKMNVVDPVGPEDGEERVVRGGAWNSFASQCRSASRGGRKPNFRSDNLGFRLVVVEVEPDDPEIFPPKEETGTFEMEEEAPQPAAQEQDDATEFEFDSNVPAQEQDVQTGKEDS